MTDPGGGAAAPVRYRRLGMMGDQDEPKEFAPLSQEEQQVLLHVVEVLRKLSYGTILLVVQDGKVVQIETAEKIRLK
jgi:hypothetical protein